MTILIALLIMIIFVIAIILTISWFVHISMVKDNNKDLYGWASYSTFVKEFNKYNWTNESHDSSINLFDREHGCRYFANIIEFNKIGMCMYTPIDWALTWVYVYYYRQRISPKIKKPLYKWAPLPEPKIELEVTQTISPDVMYESLQKKKRKLRIRNII